MPKAPTQPKNNLDPASTTFVEKVLGWLKPVPQEWIEPVEGDNEATVKALPCTNYETLLGCWKRAFRWRQDMDDVLSVMLAVTASTMRKGDQLFLMVVSNASGGKSEFCDGLTVSPYCYQLEQLTGFFSGVKDGEGNDYSLIKRVDKTCMVTSEGDVMMNNPMFNQIMAQQRRIFDGKASATYKNLLEDRFYDSLRLTWIIAGTPAIMEKDQASLGDRFLKVIMESPAQDERKKIQNRVSQIALASVRTEYEEGGATKEERIKEAQARTGGYVDWLRANSNRLGSIEVEDKYLDQCEVLAQFTAVMRSRPPKKEDSEATVEEPNRLTHQYVRLMCCLALVLNREAVDDEVMRRVSKVALDTSKGVTREVGTYLYSCGSRGATVRQIALATDKTEDATRRLLRFMSRVGLAELIEPAEDTKTAFPPRKPHWRLTDYVTELCKRVLG